MTGLIPLMLCFAAQPAQAEDEAVGTMRVLPGITQQVSEHVYVIPANDRPAVPNIGMVVGDRAILVIDSGLGKASGAVVVEEARRIAVDRPIYVLATHAHIEHYGGEAAFPEDAVVFRTASQQTEIDAANEYMVNGFAAISRDNAAVLDGFEVRPADVLFSAPLTLDLGGVTVKILSAGPAHTAGDVAVLVIEDAVLFTGDVVQENYAPLASAGDLAGWLEQIDTLESLPATILVPSHTGITDRAAFGRMRELVGFTRDRWAALRESGLDDEASRAKLVAELKERYPGIVNADLLMMPSMRF